MHVVCQDCASFIFFFYYRNIEIVIICPPLHKHKIHDNYLLSRFINYILHHRAQAAENPLLDQEYYYLHTVSVSEQNLDIIGKDIRSLGKQGVNSAQEGILAFGLHYSNEGWGMVGVARIIN